MNELRMGVYRHYKGPLYQVIALAHDADDEARTCVIYIGLQLDSAHIGPRMAVRSIEGFTESVNADPDDPEYGKAVEHPSALSTRRFKYLGPEFTPDMLG